MKTWLGICLIAFLLFAGLGYVSSPAQATVIPIAKGASTLVASTGADVTLVLPNWDPGDIFMVIGLVRDQDDTVTMTGYTALSGTPFDRSTVSRYWVFWKRATTSESNPVFDKSTATGDTYAQMVTFANTITSGNPFDVIGTPATGTSDPANCNSITTTKDFTFPVLFLGGEDDNNLVPSSSIVTATDPINWIETYSESITGSDGMIGYAHPTSLGVGPLGKSLAGDTGTITYNFDTANPVGWGCISFALVGPNVVDGFNSLVSTSTASESPGANCANGGTKVTFTSGLDNGDGGGTARDGTLQSGEIDATTIFYSCKGDTGATGANGKNSVTNITLESPGANCVYGGFLFRSGVDDNSNGVLDIPGEVDFSGYSCHGKDSVTDITVEAAGANCGEGGFRFRSGVDDDGDGTLDTSEVDFTGYACNGAEGPQGPQGPQGPPGAGGGLVMSLPFLSFFLIGFLLLTGILHPVFWFLGSFVSFISADTFTTLYPNTLWAFIFVIFGIMLLVVSIMRISGAKLGIRLGKGEQ